MNVAYFSPLNPQASGISDYSEFFLPYISRHANVDLWVDGFMPTNPTLISNYRIYDYSADPSLVQRLRQYDEIVYNIGNNPYYHEGMYKIFLNNPGVIILHDFILYYLIAGLLIQQGRERLLEEVRFAHGECVSSRMAKWLKGSTSPLKYPYPEQLALNKRLIRMAKGIVVHSQNSWEKVRSIDPSAKCVVMGMPGQILHGEPDSEVLQKIRRRYGVQDDELMLASFGHIAPTKRIHQVLLALKNIRLDKCKYILVGEGDYVREDIRNLGLANRVQITGHVELDEFQMLLAASDVVVNLRYPSMGETSASLVRALGMGKPCIVSTDAWFNEIPDHAVIKIPVDDDELAELEKGLLKVCTDEDFRQALGQEAIRYASEAFAPDRSAQTLMAFINEMHSEDQEDLVNKWCNRLGQELLSISVHPDSQVWIERLAKRLVELLT